MIIEHYIYCLHVYLFSVGKPVLHGCSSFRTVHLSSFNTITQFMCISIGFVGWNISYVIKLAGVVDKLDEFFLCCCRVTLFGNVLG